MGALGFSKSRASSGLVGRRVHTRFTAARHLHPTTRRVDWQAARARARAKRSRQNGNDRRDRSPTRSLCAPKHARGSSDADKPVGPETNCECEIEFRATRLTSRSVVNILFFIVCTRTRRRAACDKDPPFPPTVARSLSFSRLCVQLFDGGGTRVTHIMRSGQQTFPPSSPPPPSFPVAIGHAKLGGGGISAGTAARRRCGRSKAQTFRVRVCRPDDYARLGRREFCAQYVRGVRRVICVRCETER